MTEEQPVVGYIVGIHRDGTPYETGMYVTEDYMGGATELRRGYLRATVYQSPSDSKVAFWHWATTMPDGEDLKYTVLTLRKRK